MAGPEATEEREANKRLKALGWLCEKVKGYRNGWPDRLYIRQGRVVFAEWKRPDDTAGPNPQQSLRHAEIRAAGGEVFVFRTWQEAVRVLK